MIGHVDPDKQFGGAGVGLLQQNQIAVTVGVCEPQVHSGEVVLLGG